MPKELLGLPAPAQSALHYYSAAVADCRGAYATVEKARKTSDSRLTFYLKWLESVGLGSVSTFDGLATSTKNYIMGCYLIHLSLGNTLLCKSIKTDTIEEYLNEAIKYYTSTGRPNPTWDGSARRSSVVNDILVEARRWESIADRREPITWTMVTFQQQLASKHPSTTIDAALADWMVLGMYTGFRLSEWAQPSDYAAKAKKKGLPPYQLGRHKDSLAITASDIGFGTNERGSFVSITWRYQKNGFNGEKIIFAACPAYPSRCPVAATKRIIARAQTLNIPNHVPLAWAMQHGSPHLVTDTDITRILRHAAAQVYNITCDDDVTKWTSHSIRVGACVALHESGCDTTFIQNRLRWRSDSFKMYLRHTPMLAFQHARFINPDNTPFHQQQHV